MGKYKIFFGTFSFIFLISGTGFSQYPKRANIAIVESNNLSGSDLFNHCVEILENDGIQICTYNEQSLTVSTNSYFIKKLPSRENTENINVKLKSWSA